MTDYARFEIRRSEAPDDILSRLTPKSSWVAIGAVLRALEATGRDDWNGVSWLHRVEDHLTSCGRPRGRRQLIQFRACVRFLQMDMGLDAFDYAHCRADQIETVMAIWQDSRKLARERLEALARRSRPGDEANAEQYAHSYQASRPAIEEVMVPGSSADDRYISRIVRDHFQIFFPRDVLTFFEEACSPDNPPIADRLFSYSTHRSAGEQLYLGARRITAQNLTDEQLRLVFYETAIKSSFVTRYWLISPSHRVIAPLHAALLRFRITNVGIVVMDGSGEPIQVRIPRGLPVPDRRHQLADFRQTPAADKVAPKALDDLDFLRGAVS